MINQGRKSHRYQDMPALDVVGIQRQLQYSTFQEQLELFQFLDAIKEDVTDLHNNCLNAIRQSMP